MTFFIDNNLSRQLVRGMRAFGEDVTHLQDQFPADTEDPIWLQHVGHAGWTLITRDERVRFRPAELQALTEHRVGAFFLGGKGRSRCDLIQQVVRNWPRMKELAAKTSRPFAYRVPPSGGKLDRILLR